MSIPEGFDQHNRERLAVLLSVKKRGPVNFSTTDGKLPKVMWTAFDVRGMPGVHFSSDFEM